MILRRDIAAGAPSNMMSVMKTSISLLLHQIPIYNEHMQQRQQTAEHIEVAGCVSVFEAVFLDISSHNIIIQACT